jgi:hypothetical protein
MNNDALYGMISLHNYLNGGGWNKVLWFSADGNLHAHELTWWAPGQYAIPYILSKLSSLSIGTTIMVLMFASLLGGSYFYHKLFRQSGIKSTLILLAAFVLLAERFININFSQYSADILLFFYAPFYLYAYQYFFRTYGQKPVFKLLLFTVLNLLGLFIKNSFLIVELALNIFLLTELVFRRRFSRTATDKVQGKVSLFHRSPIFSPFILAVILDYYFFLRLGANPTSGNGADLTFTSILKGIFIPAIEIPFASLSISGILGNLEGMIKLSELSEGLLLVAALSIMGYLIYVKRNRVIALVKADRIFRLAVIAALVYMGCWFGFALKHSAVSNEDRLFLPATMLMLPFLLHFIFTTRSKVRYLYMMIIGASVLYGLSSFALRIKKYNISKSVFSKDMAVNGFKVFTADKNSETEFSDISKFITLNLQGYTVAVSDPDLAFQLRVTNNFLTTEKSPITVVRTGKRISKYVLLLQNGREKPPAGFIGIYASKKYSLFK